MASISLEAMIPGGIRSTDLVHHVINDGGCSRCGADTEDEVPLLLFMKGGEDLLIYRNACTSAEAHVALAPTVPTDL